MSNQPYSHSFDNDEEHIVTGSSFGHFEPSVIFQKGSSSWRGRSLLEKCLIIAFSVCLLVIIILAACLGTKHQEIKYLKQQEPCLTADCVKASSFMLSTMDTNVEPCDDFYQYACGNWIKKNSIPSGSSRYSTFAELADANELVLKHILEYDENIFQSEAVRKARRYFVSCMDANSTIEDLGITPLYDVLSRIGGWNVSDVPGIEWNVATFSLHETVKKLIKRGISPFFSVFVAEDEKNNSHNILQFDQGGISFSRDEYINHTISDKMLGAYFQYMKDITVLMGGDLNSTAEQMEKVIDFEIEIAKIMTPSDERRDEEKLYHKMTLVDLQSLAPFMEWHDLISEWFSVTEYTIAVDEPVIVFAPDFLGNVSDLVNDMLATDEGKNTLNNFMIWKAVQAVVPYLSEEFRDAGHVFAKTVNGIEGSREHWKICVENTEGVLGFAVGALFVNEVFSGESKLKADAMVDGVKKAFKNNLPNLTWMDRETRKLAAEKVDAIVDMIGYPDYILDAHELDKKYEMLEMKEDEFFLNNMKASQVGLIKSLRRLRQPPKKDRWEMNPQEVNAYYSPIKNTIVFPAGILQRPFFDQQFPVSVNYGGMGVVMGHEITHGFDDQGREYDKNGTLRKWWQPESIDSFTKQAECFVKQYSSFDVNGKNINGRQTLGENIADNGGLTAAYHAYRDYTREHGEQARLPGLDLSHDQLFFLAFAQVWCTKSKPESLHNSLLSDPHSPAKYRVLGTLSNSPDFAKHYKCKKNSPMNPADKCVIW